MRRPILNNSEPGQAIYEPFLGSGTTLIAAESTGRVCHAVELDPLYVDVAVRRWQAFTGKAALAPEGLTFDAVAAERARASDTDATGNGPKVDANADARNPLRSGGGAHADPDVPLGDA